MNPLNRFAALVSGAALLLMPALPMAQAKPASKATAKAKPVKAQNVVVTVDGSGYHPSIINVKGGRPVLMKFVSKGTGCSNEVVIPALKMKFRLKKGQAKTVAWTPKKGQSLSFACGMDMFHGKIAAK